MNRELKMFKMLIALTLMLSVGLAAEIPTLEKVSTLEPALTSESIGTSAVYKKQASLDDHHPIYRLEEHKNKGRARIEPVKPVGAVIRHDMLADGPAPSVDNEKIDNLDVSSYGYANPVEVSYPDIPYAPGYGYGGEYGNNGYDLYRNNPNDYFMEPDTSTFGLMWSQVPDSRQIASYVGRTFLWIMNSIFVLFLGSVITIGICSYTNLCSITFNGVGPIHEEMRSLITPERLENISHAANFVKTAIDKYQKIQKVTDATYSRRRRAIFS